MRLRVSEPHYVRESRLNRRVFQVILAVRRLPYHEEEMALIAVAEQAQDIAAGFNKFLDPVPEFSTEITGLISECYAISSALRELNTAKEDPRYSYDFNYVSTDVLTARLSLDYTFHDVKRLFGGLGRPTYISNRTAYYEIWKEIDDHFYQESHCSLLKRLEYNRLYLQEITCILIEGQPLEEDHYYELRERSMALLEKQELRLEATFNNLSLGDTAANRQRSFERRRPPGLFTHPPNPPPVLRGGLGARRPGPMSPQSPPGYDQEYPWAPPAPEVPNSPTTTTTFSTQSSTASSSRDHWLPIVFAQSRPTTPFRQTGEVWVLLRLVLVSTLIVPGQLSMESTSQVPVLGWPRSTTRFSTCLTLFYCAFLALRSEDSGKPIESVDDHEIHGEKSIYSGIIDDNFEHALRVFRDRDSGGIRLQASVLKGELKRTPVWTAFVTTHIQSERWMRKAGPKVIHITDLQRFVFTKEYNPQLGPQGQHEIRSRPTQTFELAMTNPQHGNSNPHEAPTPAPNAEPGTSTSAGPLKPTVWQRISTVLSYTPKRCRYDPANPPKFSTALNLLFAFAAAFTVANLYYNHPILHLLADEFSVSNERASLIPTLAQAGYAAGLVFLCPLGDVFPRRLYVLSLVLFTATVCFLTSLTTVTPQLTLTEMATSTVLPLVGDLAPPHRRASALSIVASGLLLGMLLARLLSGIVTNYTSWRTIYWLSFALQHLILLLLWLYMPDYPSANPTLSLSSYPHILWSILTIFIHHPLLIQACL
ncbi:MAG: hypothetical protein Q9184_004217, partial [Pyrenodesmia sp. 2 TL-2023]